MLIFFENGFIFIMLFSVICKCVYYYYLLKLCPCCYVIHIELITYWQINNYYYYLSKQLYISWSFNKIEYRRTSHKFIEMILFSLDYSSSHHKYSCHNRDHFEVRFPTGHDFPPSGYRVSCRRWCRFALLTEMIRWTLCLRRSSIRDSRLKTVWISAAL